MLALRNYPGTGTPASATGLTGLDQTGSNFSCAFWAECAGSFLATGGGIWAHIGTSAPVRDGIQVRNNGNGSARLSLATAAAVVNVTSTKQVFVAGWHHYAFTYDGAIVVFYRDGMAVEGVANTTAPSAGGTRNTILAASGGAYRGSLWDIQAYPNKTLSAAEVRATMDPRKTVAGCKQRLGVNWLPATSGQLTDESGNGNHLTTSATLGECDGAPPPDWYRMVTQRPRARLAA